MRSQTGQLSHFSPMLLLWIQVALLGHTAQNAVTDLGHELEVTRSIVRVRQYTTAIRPSNFVRFLVPTLPGDQVTVLYGLSHSY